MQMGYGAHRGGDAAADDDQRKRWPLFGVRLRQKEEDGERVSIG